MIQSIYQSKTNRGEIVEKKQFMQDVKTFSRDLYEAIDYMNSHNSVEKIKAWDERLQSWKKSFTTHEDFEGKLSYVLTSEKCRDNEALFQWHVSNLFSYLEV